MNVDADDLTRVLRWLAEQPIPPEQIEALRQKVYQEMGLVISNTTAEQFIRSTLRTATVVLK